MRTNEMSIEERLTKIELILEEIQRSVANLTKPVHWIDQFAGSMRGCPEFAEVVELGRAIRAADFPVEYSGHQP